MGCHGCEAKKQKIGKNVNGKAQPTTRHVSKTGEQNIWLKFVNVTFMTQHG